MSPKWLLESLDPEEGQVLDRYGIDMKIGIKQDGGLKVGIEDFAFDEDEGDRSTNTGRRRRLESFGSK
jgi:hypothetical protein